jgi:hypothetical protein
MEHAFSTGSKDMYAENTGADNMIDLSCSFINGEVYEEVRREYMVSLPAKTASNGAHCPLLRLPAELRNQIDG